MLLCCLLSLLPLCLFRCGNFQACSFARLCFWNTRDCLTNLRFADDVMLFATSKEQIRSMMCEFKDATEKVGLRIHPDKTKILSNQSNMNYDTKRYIKIGEMSIEILAKSESMKYLGQRISFHQQETLEIKSRIRAAWATFHKYRQELTSKKYMLKLRLRLFDATVSPTSFRAQSLKMMWTVKWHLMKTLIRKWIQLRSKKRIGLIT